MIPSQDTGCLETFTPTPDRGWLAKTMASIPSACVGAEGFKLHTVWVRGLEKTGLKFSRRQGRGWANHRLEAGTCRNR
ncbi:hypothetical protein E308F_18790 [Moorella sp. E308F]|nr:hypothetical protein E308F_18790 [Moorella sp. E308F]GEA19507.1 hypothetical protein E306M_26450 [Moorella sp. E306M]